MSLTDLMGAPTFRSTKGRVPVFRPLVNGVQFDITVQRAGISLSMGSHEIALMSVTSNTLTTTDGLIDSTVSFYWGQAPRTELFTGYITDVNVTQAGKGSLSFDMVIMGVTRVMQTGKPRLWRLKTIPSTVQALAYLNFLGYTGHDHPHLWKSLSQTEESDWQMVNGLASRMGWGIFTRYGVVMLYDPRQLFTENGSYCTLLSSQDQDFDATADRRLIEFNPSEVSEQNPANMGLKIAYFADNGQVQVASQLGKFKAYRFMTNFIIANKDEAQIYINAQQSTPESWKQSAEARIWGDADIYPGMSIDVITSNTAYYRSKFDGRWLVLMVQHQMDTQQFQTNLGLARPDSSTPISQSTYTSPWFGKPKPGVMPVPDTRSDVPGGERIGSGDQSDPTVHIWSSTWTDPRIRSIL